jgi:hypothetical protein
MVSTLELMRAAVQKLKNLEKNLEMFTYNGSGAVITS